MTKKAHPALIVSDLSALIFGSPPIATGMIGDQTGRPAAFLPYGPTLLVDFLTATTTSRRDWYEPHEPGSCCMVYDFCYHICFGDADRDAKLPSNGPSLIESAISAPCITTNNPSRYRLRAGLTLFSALYGWRRYGARPNNWCTRERIMVGPVWSCS
jgi:hypothetical protein